jgi:predicted MFS family arabinose efflux permease
VNIALAPLVAALTVHIARDLGQDETVLGLVLTAYGVGTVIGALSTARFSRRAVAPFLLGGTLTTGLLLTVVSRVEVIPVLLLAASIAGAAQSVVLVTYLTARTNMSPDALLGRIGSTARTLSLGLQPVGLLVGGALIDLTDGSTTIAIMGAILIGLTLVFAPVSALRRATVLPSVPLRG